MMIVTIDGPAGTGKSTVARRLAEALNFDFLDTGAMYRAVALKCLETGIDPRNSPAVTDLARDCRIEFQSQRTLVDGRDVTNHIRSVEVTEAASYVAQIPDVRALLVERQREIAQGRDTVSEGRDQGTVVFPGALCKFFLTAAPEERARRRMEELLAKGHQVDFESLLRQQTERDQRDRERAVAPLVPAADAVIVDTTSLTTDEVLASLLSEVESRR